MNHTRHAHHTTYYLDKLTPHPHAHHSPSAGEQNPPAAVSLHSFGPPGCVGPTSASSACPRDRTARGSPTTFVPQTRSRLQWKPEPTRCFSGTEECLRIPLWWLHWARCATSLCSLRSWREGGESLWLSPECLREALPRCSAADAVRRGGWSWDHRQTGTCKSEGRATWRSSWSAGYS